MTRCISRVCIPNAPKCSHQRVKCLKDTRTCINARMGALSSQWNYPFMPKPGGKVRKRQFRRRDSVWYCIMAPRGVRGWCIQIEELQRSRVLRNILLYGVDVRRWVVGWGIGFWGNCRLPLVATFPICVADCYDVAVRCAKVGLLFRLGELSGVWRFFLVLIYFFEVNKFCVLYYIIRIFGKLWTKICIIF